MRRSWTWQRLNYIPRRWINDMDLSGDAQLRSSALQPRHICAIGFMQRIPSISVNEPRTFARDHGQRLARRGKAHASASGEGYCESPSPCARERYRPSSVCG